MALGAKASRALAAEILPRCNNLKFTTVWLAPSFVALPGVAEVCRNSEIKVGAQNVHWENRGAFTGEISVPDLTEAGCEFAIVGHSERRFEIGETPALCAKRALGALGQGLKVIFCIGETLAERRDGLTRTAIIRQLQPFLSKLTEELRPLVTLAYEPVWAIGTGLAATSKEIEETHALIDACCESMLAGKQLPILYGGSVTPANFSAVIHARHVMGALIGSASLSAPKLLEMIEQSEAS